MLNDERLASALGFRVSKVYKESRPGKYGTSGGRPTPPPTTIDGHMRSGSREVVLLETGDDGEERTPITTRHCRHSAPSYPIFSSVSYVIVLLLLSASVFGLEVYRIREVGDLSANMKLVRNELELLRNQLLLEKKYENLNGEFELRDVVKSIRKKRSLATHSLEQVPPISKEKIVGLSVNPQPEYSQLRKVLETSSTRGQHHPVPEAPMTVDDARKI